MYAAFWLDVGQRWWLLRRFIVFWPNSMFLPPKWLFSKIFVSVIVLFCSGIQIRTNLCSFFIGNGSTRMTLEEVHCFSAKFHRFGFWNGIFYWKFSFQCSFYFASKFRFAQICAAFRLEMGQWAWLYRRFFVYRPNSIVSVYKMAFFSKIFISVLILFCAEKQIRTNLCSCSTGNGSTRKTP